MVAIIDYDAGNIKSVEKAVSLLGQEALLTRNREEILLADHVILPGVGAFGDAMEKLRGYGLVSVIRETADKGIPFLGICLGLQLMFESSEEAPGVAGLGLLPGKIVRIPDKEGLKIPHIGWNSLTFPNQGRLFQGIAEGAYVYFVHSLLSAGGRSADRESLYGVWHADSRFGGERQSVCLSVPSGEELGDRTENITELFGSLGRSGDAYKADYSLSGCEKRQGG